MNAMKFRLFFLLLLTMYMAVGQEHVSAIYGGGGIYNGRNYSTNELKKSGFNTVIVWTIHIDEEGNLNFNVEFPLVTEGVYVGDQSHPNFRSDLKELKSGNSNVKRIEFGLSAWGSPTYENIKNLIQSEGTGPSSRLYKNFKALIEAIPEIDAFNNDDEVTYDVASSVAFHTMLFELGVKTTGVPYKNASTYWKPFIDQMLSANPGSVDLMYLQVYAGGAGNDPCDNQWQSLGVPIVPGLWAEGSSDGNKNARQIRKEITEWNNRCAIKGGFLWLYDDFDNSALVSEYAEAINAAFNGN